MLGSQLATNIPIAIVMTMAPTKITMTRKLFGAFAILFLMISFNIQNAKADLVDELIKKHKLDPQHILKDHCWLMVQLSYKIGGESVFFPNAGK